MTNSNVQPQSSLDPLGQVDARMALEQAARDDLAVFSVLSDPSYGLSWHHRDIAQKLMAVERGEIKRLMLFLPPRHGKSQLATINFPAWYLGKHPDREIITASYSGDLAVRFGGYTRDLVQSPEFQSIFGVSLKQDEKGKAEWRTAVGGSYVSVGVGGALTGRGANVLLIDDPIKNREEAESEVYREKVWDWFTSVAYTRLEKNGAIILIMTRWHLWDLAGRILAKEGAKEWTVVNYPAIATQDEPNRKKGDPLWPEKYDLGALEGIKRDIGTLNWAALYQQNPILSENQEFKTEHFHPVEMALVDAKLTRNFMTVDTAISQRASGDFTGIVMNYVDSENRWHLRARKYKINPADLIRLLFHLQEENGFEKIGIEKTIYLDVFKILLDEEMRKRGVFLPIVPLEHKQIAKETRIRGLIPRYEAGAIWHIEGECADLEEELLSFPRGINDDVLDACAYQLAIASAPNESIYAPQLNLNRSRYGYAANR